MNKKITISELSQLLSTNVSLINKKGWEDFLRIFFAQISEGLQAEGNVKIKGLGTFKVVTVDARKSKDVNTGENTIIPAHNKISFTPDAALAETLNKPYAHFEATYVLAPDGEVDAPESEDEEETVASEVKTETVETTPVIETVVEEPVVATAMDNLENVAEVQTTVTEPVIENIVETQTVATEPVVEPIVETQSTVTEPVIVPIVETQSTVTEPVIETQTVITEPVAEVKTEPVAENPVETKTVEIEQTAASEVEKTESSTQEEDVIEETEETEEEDPNADEDENVDTTPEETKAYASTFKRHDLKNDDDDDDDDKNSHSKKLGIAIILFLCILAVVGLVAWMSDPNIVQKLRSKLTDNEPIKTEVKIESASDLEETKEIEDKIIAEKAEENIEEKNALVDKIETEATDNVDNKSTAKHKVEKTTNFKGDFIKYMQRKHPEMDITDQGDPIEEKLGNASRLTLVSLRHYGAKDFWIYIYLYNKDVIKNPNHIKAGTKIKVPMLDNKKLVNPESEHSILTAKEVQHEFVK